MQKLTSILVVADNNEELQVALDKAITLSRIFSARLELLVAAPHEALTRRVRLLKPDLVIKACVARHPLRRWTLNGNDWRLARDCAAPLLLARARPWSQPPTFAAAVDVADEDNVDLARALLQITGFLALGAHAPLDILYSEREDSEERLRIARTVRLAQIVREFHVGLEHIRRVEGDPDRTLPALAAGRDYDVLALGTPSRSEALAGLRPGTASRLIEASQGDVLLVRAPRQPVAEQAERSFREQHADQRQEFA